MHVWSEWGMYTFRKTKEMTKNKKPTGQCTRHFLFCTEEIMGGEV